MNSLAGSMTIGWVLPEGCEDDIDPRALLERIENTLAAALPQLVDVYIDGEDRPPVRVIFDLGCHQIEIEDGPVNGSLDDLREELEES